MTDIDINAAAALAVIADLRAGLSAAGDQIRDLTLENAYLREQLDAATAPAPAEES